MKTSKPGYAGNALHSKLLINSVQGKLLRKKYSECRKYFFGYFFTMLPALEVWLETSVPSPL
jgi:hypothetical protein